ncbi:hypothetical protein J6590_005738 [Homalodisca vitripennis]|nr:hypothetical protein J6590_005738 [Homalodisca vitripennis]
MRQGWARSKISGSNSLACLPRACRRTLLRHDGCSIRRFWFDWQKQMFDIDEGYLITNSQMWDRHYVNLSYGLKSASCRLNQLW